MLLLFAEHRDSFGDCWPVKDCSQIVTAIEDNYGKLVDLLDTEYGDLIRNLRTRDCITNEQMKKLESTTNSFDINKMLLDIILRSSVEKFIVLLDCVHSTQPHLARLLKGDTGNKNTGN